VGRSFTRAPSSRTAIRCNNSSGGLRAIPEKSLTGQDRLSYRLLDWQLEQEIADTDIVSDVLQCQSSRGRASECLSSTMAVAPPNTVKDYENQVARLRALPRWWNQTIAAANLAIAQKKSSRRLVAEREWSN